MSESSGNTPSSLYKIELLRDDNWIPWKIKIEAILDDRGLEGHIDGANIRKKSGENIHQQTMGSLDSPGQHWTALDSTTVGTERVLSVKSWTALGQLWDSSGTALDRLGTVLDRPGTDLWHLVASVAHTKLYFNSCSEV
jgi:hypothetical protein